MKKIKEVKQEIKELKDIVNNRLDNATKKFK